MRLWSCNLHPYLTAVDFNWFPKPSTSFNLPLFTKNKLPIQARRTWAKNRLKRQESCNNDPGSSESLAAMITKGNLEIMERVSIFLGMPALRHVLLIKHWTLSEAPEKDGQTCLYFIKFSVFSFISAWCLPSERSNIIFKEHPGEGGCFSWRPGMLTSQVWCQTLK